ncbi:NmrA family NAD(P)-binding protein [Bradyrhizobium sp. U87765 SZCCT0131]|uniref:SDR family oxidoreductase n=1 Tax=unclassified Bradyrhizobium TaxID=2631580 RepID=UPI001BAC98A1|nr:MULTISPECIES: NmrA family NAD(P)-binding protein [unclassified Bradyrhizobium]MBR1221275.1 NmrA family NAD(P)-binding protein [Bradyrhizobium sp. U87765 SZCCT0131]MBR1259904.1 NmrA family NAD(P)-binding protein [Bradyrhizobium sp. U87765 SZCCT0134]MBR1307847.1 NmrA family NAD(P)-binding protein [Bradyrhizobium sp. U87765 SZCCT0110]MBR1321801.1 NmrA family NAD(P)-binding protein [Bradyrhizobium sp. U87765 SZCCT0109]MBR1350113.1 NmrA family NAD(P)-binding protein [Bradyrhizobium sp. U87765 SZ
MSNPLSGLVSGFEPSKPVLVTLANGVQGGAVVRAALARGLRVRALVRDRAGAQPLAAQGAEIAVGDLDDAATLIAACDGAGALVLQVPIGPLDIMRVRARHALVAARAGGVAALVLKLASASRPAPCEEPSFVANAAMTDDVRCAGLPFAVVRPTMYLDNLLKPSALAEIATQGVFAPPIAAGQRIAWTSAADCAEAAVMLLVRGMFGGDHRIAGPESVSGDELARRISDGLGRRIVYRAQPLDEFEREVDAAMGFGMGRRVASKFRFFAQHRAEADAILAGAFTPQPGLDGFVPQPIASWVRAHLLPVVERERGGVHAPKPPQRSR